MPTLDEAIKILTEQLNFILHECDQEYVNALKLGIEALKEVKDAREIGFLHPKDLLPGETEK